MRPTGYVRLRECEVSESSMIVRSEIGSPYLVFSDYRELFDYIVKLPASKRCLHEVPLANQRQKARFDVDVLTPTEAESRSVSEDVLSRLILATESVLIRDGVPCSLKDDFAVYSSHGPTTEGYKCSYHVIMCNHYHSNCKEAEAFCDQVMAIDSLSPLVDTGIYKRNHPLRLCGCVKRGSRRFKVYCPEFTVGGAVITHRHRSVPLNKNHEKFIEFVESLLTAYTGGYLIPSYVPETDECYSESFICDEALRDIIKHSCALFSCSEGELPFRVTGVDRGIIVTKRVSPSWCSVCSKEHTSVPPIIIVVGNAARLYCQRAKVHNPGATPYVELGEVADSLSVAVIDRAPGLLSRVMGTIASVCPPSSTAEGECTLPPSDTPDTEDTPQAEAPRLTGDGARTITTSSESRQVPPKIESGPNLGYMLALSITSNKRRR